MKMILYIIILTHTAVLMSAMLITQAIMHGARCQLDPHMKKDFCEIPLRQIHSKLVEEDRSEMNRDDTESKSSRSVPDGTSCSVEFTPDITVSITCSAGKWEFAGRDEALFPRRKRNTYLRENGEPDLTRPEVGEPPSITCSEVNTTIYTEKGKVTAAVFWQKATAPDKEKVIRIMQTEGQTSGSQHREGEHQVSYIAWDKLGQAAMCSVTFMVVVRRCRHEFTYLLNGTADCTPDDYRYIFGSVCLYSCVPGYELIGKSSLECLSTGAWSGNKPYCRAISCGAPRKIEHGFLACETSQFTFMSKCEVVCDEGYFVIGQNDLITCQANGQWTTPGECQVKLCEELKAVKNSSISCTANNVYGSECTFTCDPPYVIAREAIRTCQVNQTWSGSQPECVNTCHDPPVVPHGHFVCENGRKPGDLCFLMCDKGYKATDPRSITCNRNFQWTKSGFCLDIEPPVPIEDCTSNGELTANELGSPNYVTYPIPSFTDNSGESVNVAGKPPSLSDFPLGPTTVLITATDSARNNFTCQFFVTITTKFCRDPRFALESSDPIRFHCPDGFAYGASCTVSCSNGKAPQGMKSIKCNLNSDYDEPQWLSEGDVGPYCQDKCSPGQWSVTGHQPCEPCQQGTYQEKYGSTKCQKCPYLMITPIYGAMSKLDCRFTFNHMSLFVDKPSINLTEDFPSSFTILARVYMKSAKPKMTLKITLDPLKASIGSVYLSLDYFAVYVVPYQNLTATSFRRWYHVAVVFNDRDNAGLLHLYLDGEILESVKGLQPGYLSSKSFNINITGGSFYAFLGNDMYISEFQMTQAALTHDEVREFYRTCEKQVDDNVLVSPSSKIYHRTLSHCDNDDNCRGNPCGPHGTCYDGFDKFTCECDKPWSGKTCQVAPNFCSNHTCTNGASCVNNIQYKNFTCVCADGYKGPLCKDEVVNGGWGMWKEWSSCSKDCGPGQRSRIRLCDSPRPDSTGKSCLGDREEQQKCFGDQCPVNGIYGPWSDWSTCSVTCGGGEMFKRRTCDNPAPSNGGASCDGIAVSSVQCNTVKCPECLTLQQRSGHQSLECSKNVDKSLTSCQIVCKPGMTIVSEFMNKFQCGHLTNYTWTHQTNKNPTGILPECSEVTHPEKSNFVVSYSYENVPCSTAELATSFTQSIRQKIFHKLNCSSHDNCNVSVINICDGKNRQSGRLLVEVSHRSKQTSEEERSAVYGKSQILDIFLYVTNTSSDILRASAEALGYTAHIERAQIIVQCPNGTGYSDGVCVDCPPGSYSAGNASCKLCEKGFYQDQGKMTSCIRCPDCFSTEGEGSFVAGHCLYVGCSTPTPVDEEKQQFPLIIVLAVGFGCFIIATLLVIIIQKNCRKQRETHPYDIPDYVKNENSYEDALRDDPYDVIEDDPYICVQDVSAESLLLDAAGYIKPETAYDIEHSYLELVANSVNLRTEVYDQPEDDTRLKSSKTADLEDYVKQKPIAGLEDYVKQMPSGDLEDYVKQKPIAGLEDYVKQKPSGDLEDYVKQKPSGVLEDYVKQKPSGDLEDYVKQKPLSDLEDYVKQKPSGDIEDYVKQKPIAGLEDYVKQKPSGDLEDYVKQKPSGVLEDYVKQKPSGDLEDYVKQKPLSDLEDYVKQKPSGDLEDYVKQKPSGDLEDYVKQKPLSDLEDYVKQKPSGDLEDYVKQKPSGDLEDYVKQKPLSDLEDYVKQKPSGDLEDYVKQKPIAGLEDYVKQKPSGDLEDYVKQKPSGVLEDYVKQKPSGDLEDYFKQKPLSDLEDYVKQKPSGDLEDYVKQKPSGDLEDYIKQKPLGDLEDYAKQKPSDDLEDYVKQKPSAGIEDYVKQKPSSDLEDYVKQKPSAE